MRNLVKYLIICFIFALAVVLYNWISPKGQIYGFWEGIKILILMTIFPAIGMGIGNTIRMWIMPDRLYANGAVDMAKSRIFWAIGPQSIGYIAGLMVISKWIS